MADITTSRQSSPAIARGLASELQGTPEVIASMPPRRRVRGPASPSPAPQGSRGSTPADRGGMARTPVPAKYSTSYGSPMTQLPDRSTAGGGSITKAAAEIFTKVKRDNVAAEARRRNKDQARAARATRATRAARAGSQNTTASPPPAATPPTIEEVDVESEEGSEGQSSSGAEGSEYGDRNGTPPERRSPRKPQPRDVRKRARDDEDEARAEKERKERDARLARERSAEARKVRNQKLAEAQAAREKAEQERKAEEERQAEQRRIAEQERQAEQERRAQQAAREEAARAAMPPPPQPLVPRPAPTATPIPPDATNSADAMDHRPGSARSFIEEGKLFQEANVQTPTPPPARQVRRLGPSAPPEPPQAAQGTTVRTRLSALPPGPPSPPSVLKRPPRRPGGTTPAPRHERRPSPGANDDRGSTSQSSPEEPSPESDEKNHRQHDSPSNPFVAASYAQRLRSRFKPLAGKSEFNAAGGHAQAESPRAPASSDYLPRWSGAKRSFSLLSVLKLLAGGFVMLHLIRLVHTLVRPDLFEPAITWYGWNDWINNIGQFLPSPLLHPLGVLTDDQYDDLKDYLQRRTTATEAAVNNLQSVLPKVVSVRKDQKGKVIIADEFWTALKDKIEHDSRILSLDGKSRISESHWRAIEQRLKDASLLAKPLSADDVEKIVDKSAPASWEKWLAKNKQRVADILGHGTDSSRGSPSDSPKGTTESVVSRSEFLRELTARLSESRKEVETEMGGLRKDLDGVLREVKKLASEGGMSRAETTSLINRIVDKEITGRLTRIGSKSGAAKIDAAFSNRVNLFSPGNNAQVDISLSSPTYEIVPPPVGSKKYLKSMPRQAPFLPDKSQALRPWTEPGHCWCAAILGARNRTHPAVLAVRLAQFVIPQHVLLEHIDPAATTDPLAMPRDVEIWAMFDEHARRERVLDWMAVQFPADITGAHNGNSNNNNNNNNQKLISEGWAKIGHFVYQHRPEDEGVYVHHLSRDLVDLLGAATDLVMVRALTNYGAKDHTCFYRVRLYGEVVEEEE
ncbi:hypothetical protein L209DRAFT_669326, partial [Thermothelomyces heterothallicus CBS 203.75]